MSCPIVTTIRGVVIQTGPTSGIKMLTITNTPDLSNTLDSTINGSKDVSSIDEACLNFYA